MVFHSNASTCVSVCESGLIIQTKQRRKCQNERQQRLLREGGVSCQVWLPQFAQSSFSNSVQGTRALLRTMHMRNLLHLWWLAGKTRVLTIPVCRYTQKYIFFYKMVNLILFEYLRQKKKKTILVVAPRSKFYTFRMLFTLWVTKQQKKHFQLMVVQFFSPRLHTRMLFLNKRDGDVSELHKQND